VFQRLKVVVEMSTMAHTLALVKSSKEPRGDTRRLRSTSPTNYNSSERLTFDMRLFVARQLLRS
jgi:hypothetical protein